MFAELAFEVLDVATGAEKGDEVSACGGAPDGDFAGIEPMLFGVGFDPANGGFAIVDLGRPLSLVGEAVANRDACVVTALDESGEVV